MWLANQSLYSLGIIEFPSELYNNSGLAGPIVINEKCRKLNPTWRKTVCDYKQLFFSVNSTNTSIQNKCFMPDILKISRQTVDSLNDKMFLVLFHKSIL